MAVSLKTKTVKGTIWSTIERFSLQGVQFVVMIIMARILAPADYGLVGMLTIFLAISQSFIDSGFSQALIRKQDRTEVDNSTVFYFNIGMGLFAYLILFLGAPLISRFYNEPLLTPITRVLGLNLIFNSLVVVQRALFTINLNFKTQAIASLIGVVTSGTIGIWMAYAQCGVWAIVVYQLVNAGMVMMILWILSNWRPILVFSKKSFYELFSFGSKMLFSGLLNTIYNNLYLIVIGKIYKPADLGYYTRAYQFADIASGNLTGVLQRVSYPVLCTIQNDDNRLSEVYRKLLRISAYIIFPLMMGMAAIAKPMVIAILTEKWEFTSTLLVPLCFALMWYPIHAINLNLLQVKGRSDLFLRLEIIKKIIGVTIMCFTLPLGLIAMCWGLLIGSLISLILNTHYTGKFINLGFTKQIMDLFPIFMLSLVTGAVIWMTVSYLPVTSLLKLLIGIAEGIIVYAGCSKLLRFTEFSELVAIIRHKS